VGQAARAGLKAVAITDHDTMDGLAEALAVGQEAGIEVVPGVEISVQGGPTGSLHMLGLFVDHRAPGLAEGLKRLQNARAERNPKIVAKFNELGIPMTMEEVAAHAGGDLVGRPHFARVLLERGIVRDRGEAFARYLGANAPAYVPKYRFSPAEGMGMILAAGGVPVLAHPGMLKLPTGDLEKLVRELMRDGLEGLEALYSEHDQALRNWLTSLAARLGLVISGGTDFHGQAKPDIRLGLGWGDLRVPAGVLVGLKERRQRLHG
jgi:predicted metal-dependent phosphoesterase TrpH